MLKLIVIKCMLLLAYPFLYIGKGTKKSSNPLTAAIHYLFSYARGIKITQRLQDYPIFYLCMTIRQKQALLHIKTHHRDNGQRDKKKFELAAGQCVQGRFGEAHTITGGR